MTEATVSSALREGGGKYDAKIEPDIIKGWNDRRLSNNVNLSSLTPFVQLIGIFNEKEYAKMFGAEEGMTPVYFAPHAGSGFAGGEATNLAVRQSAGIEEPKRVGMDDRQSALQERESTRDWIQNQLLNRFINLHIYEGREKPSDDTFEGNFDFTIENGIMMAEYASQAGGVHPSLAA